MQCPGDGLRISRRGHPSFLQVDGCAWELDEIGVNSRNGTCLLTKVIRMTTFDGDCDAHNA
jgi:hypothetical protein